jgi:hypothetical protein
MTIFARVRISGADGVAEFYTNSDDQKPALVLLAHLNSQGVTIAPPAPHEEVPRDFLDDLRGVIFPPTKEVIDATEEEARKILAVEQYVNAVWTFFRTTAQNLCEGYDFGIRELIESIDEHLQAEGVENRFRETFSCAIPLLEKRALHEVIPPRCRALLEYTAAWPRVDALVRWVLESALAS